MDSIQDIINFALRLAHQQEIHEADINDPQGEFKDALDIYNLYLERLTNSRPWLYAHTIYRGSQITDITDTGIPERDILDLGYKYQYTLPASTLEVLCINKEENDRFRNVIPNTQQALRAGISYIPEIDGLPSKDDTGFAFVNGVLHSDTEVKSVFAKKKIDAVNAPASFKIYLSHTIAVVYADTLGQSSKRAMQLEDKIPSIAMEAVRDEQSFQTNTHYSTILNWINTYYTHAYTFANNNSSRGKY